MDAVRVGSKEVVSCQSGDTVRRVAELMRARHVGAIVVMEAGNGRVRPSGILTDRDLVVEVLATGLDPEAITAGDLAVGPLVTAHQDDSMLDTVHRMRSRGVRRLPILDARGELVGIVTMDDVLHALTHELATLVRVAEHQPSQEARVRR